MNRQGIGFLRPASLATLLATLLATSLGFAACQLEAEAAPAPASLASAASTGTDPASGTEAGQAPYRQLDPNDDASWSAASGSGELREGALIVKTSAAFDSSVLAGIGAAETARFAVADGSWRHLSVAIGSERAALASLRGMAGIISAMPENILRIPEGERSGTMGRGVGARAKALGSPLLDDPYVASAEYNLAITHALDAYATYTLDGSSKIAYAAVLDSGINLPHEDFNAIGSGGALSQSIVVRGMSAFSRNSATSYSYVGDGAPLVQMTTGINWDDDGHGSHVSGIIGAVGDNGKGLAGVMWKGLRLISYKVITDNESDSLYGSGGDWAVYGSLKNLADWWSSAGSHPDAPNQLTLPVNMSLGSAYASPFEIEMIAYALRKNVLVCASMGNDGRTTAEYPAAYTGVIAVGATDGTDARALFSTKGDWMSVCAPGYDIISTFNGSTGDYEWDSGTSMSAPFVTGLAAYILAFAPTLTPDQVKTIIEMSADKIGGGGTYTTEFGFGRVNVKRALDIATGNARDASGVALAIPAPGSIYGSGTLTISLESASGSSSTVDQEVYLYDSSGAFVEFGYTSDNYLVPTLPGGQVSFSLLRPGAYTAKINYGGIVYSSTVTVGSSGDESAIINLP